MGESIGILAILTVGGVVAFAVLVRMVAQVVKDSGREKKMTEAMSYVLIITAQLANYSASAVKTEEQVKTINGMIDAYNQRYNRWRGFVKLPPLVA
ncbi:MAG: hypothetical protein ACT4QA_03305 [Panacagrimonas sp.]